MQYFVNSTGSLYVYEDGVTNFAPGLTPSPSKPGDNYIWSDGAWVDNSASVSVIAIINSNAPIKKQLKQIDDQSIRAIRTGDVGRLTALEEQATALRAQLK